MIGRLFLAGALTVALSAPADGIVLGGLDSGDDLRSASSAADVDGDGFDDVIVGAEDADPGGVNSAGKSYVIFGGDFRGSVTHFGFTGADTLTGSGADDVMVGGLGDDVLIGNGGEDVLRGGAGDDVLAVDDTGYRRIDGAGLDLDLTTTSNSKITEVEQIDLTGSGNNSLTLNLQDVLDISDTSNTPRVFGDARDTVETAAAWDTGTVVEDGAFTQYSIGLATLLIDNDVTQDLTGP